MPDLSRTFDSACERFNAGDLAEAERLSRFQAKHGYTLTALGRERSASLFAFSEMVR